MRSKKAYSNVRFGTFFLMPSYLFIVVAHLFFAPNFHSGTTLGYNPVLKRNTELIYNLIRTDRCLSNESKTVKTFAKNLPPFSISLLIKSKPLLNTAMGNTGLYQFLPDHHSSYLSNRVIRI